MEAHSTTGDFKVTQEQADMRREELARVIVTKHDERIRELEEAVQILGEAVAAWDTWNTGKAPCSGMYPNLALKFAMANVNANPTARTAAQ